VTETFCEAWTRGCGHRHVVVTLSSCDLQRIETQTLDGVPWTG
jgi:hypothetical protein